MSTETQRAGAVAPLQRDAIGLAPVLFQSITHMAPGAAVAFSIIFAVTYAGGATPLAILLAECPVKQAAALAVKVRAWLVTPTVGPPMKMKGVGVALGLPLAALLGVALSSVQGPVKFDSLGRNLQATTFVFQWQNGKFVQVLPVAAAGSVKILNPKPAWKS